LFCHVDAVYVDVKKDTLQERRPKALNLRLHQRGAHVVTRSRDAKLFYSFELSTGYIGISSVPTQYDNIICTIRNSTVAVLLHKSTVANRYDVKARVILFAGPRDEGCQISDNRRDWLELMLNDHDAPHLERDSCLMNALQAEIDLWLEIAMLKKFTFCF
jgi:hypothetical protein